MIFFYGFIGAIAIDYTALITTTNVFRFGSFRIEFRIRVRVTVRYNVTVLVITFIYWTLVNFHQVWHVATIWSP